MEDLITKFIEKPTKLVSEVGMFMKDITPYLMNLNEQLEDKKFLAQHPTLFDLMAKCLVYLLDMLLRQFKAFFDYHNMKSTGPLNCAMGVFMLMQNFVALMEDRVDNKHKPWQMHTSAKDLPFLLANKLCVSDKLVKSYTHDEMTMALYVLGVKWVGIDWRGHAELEQYLLGLLHRLCMLCICVDKTIHDIATGADGATRDKREIENEIYRINVLRSRACMQLFKMLYIVRFIASADKVMVPTDKDDEIWRQVEHLRTYSIDLVKILTKTREAKAEIYAALPKIMILYGDVEMFVNKRGLENARPNSLLMTVRSEAQQAMTLMHQFVILESVQRNMHDEDEDHFKRFTRMEHSYMLIFKAYMINMAIKDTKTEKKVDIDFFKDFIIYEHDILHFYDRFSKHDEPVVLHIMGKMHVFFKGKLYMCNCIEMAVVIWARLILNNCGGRIGTSDVTKQMRNILGVRLGEEDLAADITVMVADMHIVSKGKILN